MFEPDSARIVVNPAAAGGRVGRQLKELGPEIERWLGGGGILRTEAPGDAARLAEEAVRGGVTTLLSMGGDGTHSAVVDGIMRAGAEPGAVALGILPAGTGGDFPRLLASRKDLGLAIRGMQEAEGHPVDVGRLRHVDDEGNAAERHFLNITSFGIGGLVDRIVNRSSKKLGGKTTFFLATLRALMRYRGQRLRLVLDGEDVGSWRVLNVAVANGRYFGGGMFVAPDARLGDGLFDVVVMEHRSAFATAIQSRKIYKGAHLGAEGVHHFRAAHVRAEPLDDAEILLDVDGEAPGRLPADLEIRPGAIRLLGAQPDVL